MGFPAGLWLALISSVTDLSGRGQCLPTFYRGSMYMCVYTYTHTLHVGYSDVNPGLDKTIG